MSAVRPGGTVGHRADGPYAAALRRALPTRDHELLLRACLCEPSIAQSAWTEFSARVGDAKLYFEADEGGLKGLLPFVEASLARNCIDAGKAFHTYARVAAVREELRSGIYSEVLAGLLDALERAGVSNVLLKGAALSATVYPQPSTRHNHAIDVWVAPGQLQAAEAIVVAERFELRLPTGPRRRGASGVPSYHWACDGVACEGVLHAALRTGVRRRSRLRERGRDRRRNRACHGAGRHAGARPRPVDLFALAFEPAPGVRCVPSARCASDARLGMP